MTTIEAPALYVPTRGPVASPYRFGLDSVMAPTDVEHGELGITWESQNAAVAHLTNDPCVDPSADLFGDGVETYCSIGQADPFTVFVYDTDSIAGLPTSVHEQRVRDRFAAAEQHGAEAGFAAQLAGASVTPVSVALGSTPQDKVLAALAAVERDLADLTGVQGVIFMSRYAAMFAGDELVAQGGVLRTRLGTPVAAMGGGNLGTVVYGTGPLVAMRGPVTPTNAVPNYEINDVALIVHRTYAIGWDVGIVAADAGFTPDD